VKKTGFLCCLAWLLELFVLCMYVYDNHVDGDPVGILQRC